MPTPNTKPKYTNECVAVVGEYCASIYYSTISLILLNELLPQPIIHALKFKFSVGSISDTIVRFF